MCGRRNVSARSSEMLSAAGTDKLSAAAGGGVAILSGGEESEREPAYVNSASLGPFDNRAATDRSAGRDSSLNADASGSEAARFFGRAIAIDLRRRFDCSVSGPAGFSTAANRGTVAGSDTTVELDATTAACGVAAAACSVAAGCVTTVECGTAAAAFGVAVAECGEAAGCVTTTGCKRTAGYGLAGDSRGALEAAPNAAGDIAEAVFERAPEAPVDIAPAAFEEAPEAPEAPDDIAPAAFKVAPEAPDDVAVSVGKRVSLATVPDRIAYSSSAITVEFAVLSLIRPIIYFANSGLNFKAFDDSADFCNCGSTGFWIGVAVSRKAGFAKSFAAEIDAGTELVTPGV